ncbi:MAG: hypothetical protein Fues2KO_38370 [Fuerstiella sp.]
MICFARTVLTAVLLLVATGCADDEAAPDAASVQDSTTWPQQLQPPPENDLPGGRWLDMNFNGRVQPQVQAFRADGRWVAVDVPGQSVLYDLSTGQPLHAWRKPEVVLQISYDGRHVLTQQQRTFRIYSGDSYKLLAEFSGQLPEASLLTSRNFPIAKLNASDQVVAISNAGHAFDDQQPSAVLLYQLDRTLLARLPVADRMDVTALQFVGPSRLLIQTAGSHSGRYQRRWTLWDTNTQQPAKEFPWGHRVAVSDDQQWLASAVVKSRNGAASSSANSLLYLYSLPDGQQMYEMTAPGEVRDFSLRPDGQKLLAAVDAQLFEWDLNTGRRQPVSAKQDLPLASVCYSDDGMLRFASVEKPNGVDDDVDHFLRVFSVATGQRLSDSEVQLVSYNGTEDLYHYPSGDRFIDRAADFAVRDCLSGEVIQRCPELRSGGSPLLRPAGQNLLLTNSFLTDLNTGRQRVWSLSGLDYQFVRDGRSVFVHSNTGLYFNAVATGLATEELLLSARGLTWAAASDDGQTIASSWHFRDPLTGKPTEHRLVLQQTLADPNPIILNHDVRRLTFLQNNRQLVTANSKSIRLHNAVDGGVIRELRSIPGQVTLLRRSPTSDLILIAGINTETQPDAALSQTDRGWCLVLEPASGKVVELDSGAAPVTCGRFSDDGRFFVTGPMDGTVRVWNTETGEPKLKRCPHRAQLADVAFTADGQWIISSAVDGIAVWPISDGAEQTSAARDPLPDSFRIVEYVNPWNGQRTPKEAEPLFHDVEAFDNADAVEPNNSIQPNDKNPAAEFSLVVVGDGDSFDDSFHPARTRWLKQAASRHQVPANPYERAPEPEGSSKRATSSNGRWIAWEQYASRKILVTDVDAVVKYSVPQAPSLSRVTVSNDGLRLSIVDRASDRRASDSQTEATDAYRLRVVDAESGQSLFEPLSFERYPTALQFSSDGRQLLLQLHHREVRLYNALSGELLGSRPIQPGHYQTQSHFSPDGNRIAVTSKDSLYVELCDANGLQQIAALKQRLPVDWIRFDATGRRLLVAQSWSADRCLLTVWDVEERERLSSQVAAVFQDGTFDATGELYLSHQNRMWTVWDLNEAELKTVILSSDSSPPNQPVFGPPRRSVHLGDPKGRRLWPMPEPAATDN